MYIIIQVVEILVHMSLFRHKTLYIISMLWKILSLLMQSLKLLKASLGQGLKALISIS